MCSRFKLVCILFPALLTSKLHSTSAHTNKHIWNNCDDDGCCNCLRERLARGLKLFSLTHDVLCLYSEKEHHEVEIRTSRGPLEWSMIQRITSSSSITQNGSRDSIFFLEACHLVSYSFWLTRSSWSHHAVPQQISSRLTHWPWIWRRCPLPIHVNFQPSISCSFDGHEMWCSCHLIRIIEVALHCPGCWLNVAPVNTSVSF